MKGGQMLVRILLFLVLIHSLAWGQNVTADFGNRSGTTLPIAPGFMGVSGVGSTLSDPVGLTLMTATTMNQTRIFAGEDVFDSSGTPNYSLLDAQMVRAQIAGFHPLVVISGTPPSLGARACTPPSSSATWASIAAGLVSHLSANHPGLVTDYEIWNEPDGQASLCAGSTAANLTAYLSIYAAAGAAIRSADSTVRIGGPTLSAPAVNLSWITSLTSGSTAQYVDFVSVHIYVTGQFEINNGMTWATLYNTTQSATKGLEHYYQAAEALVRGGSQPNPSRTPIYVTEYNDNNAFALECCRNDPTYGPLWNSVAIMDMLNAGYSGASTLPAKLHYFASTSSASFFCMVGNVNAAHDCAPTAFAAYPQYFAYQLFSSPQYLNAESGGYMAASVSPASTTSGLMATAFYTATADNIVIVNPGTTPATAAVSAFNTGFAGVSGKVYLLNGSNPTISTSTPAISQTTSGYTMSVAVPALSTVAVSLSSLPCP